MKNKSIKNKSIKNKSISIIRTSAVCMFTAVFLLCGKQFVMADTGMKAEMPDSFSAGEGYETGTQVYTGWKEIDGKRYYFFLQTGQMAQGWQEIDGESYYFEPETGELASGYRKLEDGSYYFSPVTGVMQIGWQNIGDGKRYFSPSSGRMLTGWQKIGGKRYYFSKDSGEAVTGVQKIDDAYYIFDSKGRLAQSEDKSLVTVAGSSYCADKNGKAAPGWHYIGKKLYYASKNGKLKKNTTYQGIAFGSKGAAKDNNNSRLKIKAMQTMDAITNKRMTKSQKLEACWNYITGGNFRYAVKYPNLNASGWQRKTACDMLSSGSGNCYGFACAFAALAEEAGYEPYIVCGRVRGSRDRASDGYTRHAWVRINGRYYDPEAQYAGWRRGVYGWSSYTVSHTVQEMVAF